METLPEMVCAAIDRVPDFVTCGLRGGPQSTATDHFPVPRNSQAEQRRKYTDQAGPLVGMVKAGLEQQHSQHHQGEPCRYPARRPPPTRHDPMMNRTSKIRQLLLENQEDRYIRRFGAVPRPWCGPAHIDTLIALHIIDPASGLLSLPGSMMRAVIRVSSVAPQNSSSTATLTSKLEITVGASLLLS
ncbi:hypothetical protein AB0L44_22015 [Nonomuraea wenchangensis]|uniref:hypothetical protein n=1 Tax=Nonomuraea wenchangensis TaxID=568860 RepID=UPI00342CDDC3